MRESTLWRRIAKHVAAKQEESIFQWDGFLCDAVNYLCEKRKALAESALRRVWEHMALQEPIPEEESHRIFHIHSAFLYEDRAARVLAALLLSYEAAEEERAAKKETSNG